MTRQRTRGSYSVGVARKAQILDAAIAHFEEVGYSRTSMARIAADVGLTGPGLSHYFPTKEHLLVAAAERRFDILSDWATDDCAITDGTRPLRRMLHLAEMLLSRPGLIELFAWSPPRRQIPQPQPTPFSLRGTRVIAALRDGFQEGVDAGTLRADVDYEQLARECVAVADGLQLQWVLSGGTIDLLSQTRSHLERIAPTILVSGARIDLSQPAPGGQLDPQSAALAT